jgi:acyl-CoA synthetase (AMP-forming)/AMP-acid ligase II
VNLMMLLEMAASGYGDRVAFGGAGGGITYEELLARAGAGAEVIRSSGATHVAFVAENGPAFPVAVFAAAWAGVPFIPLNYRLSAEQIEQLLAAHDPALVIVDDDDVGLLGAAGAIRVTPSAWLEQTAKPATDPQPWADDADAVAVLLYTSGTTSAPKAAILRHRHLVSYVFGTVEFASAAEDDASLVSVPPYHIAGVSNVLSNVYSGRRVVQLAAFTPEQWLETARREQVTHALVVPTMLARVVEHLGDAPDAGLPTLRSLAYGGARMPATVIERALNLFPDANFVNAYGLTETSSTIAVLGPDDHRAAIASDDPAVRARLGSAGLPIPGLELEVRDENGTTLAPGEVGELWVRGEQVSGEYAGRPSALDVNGWFDTRDRGWVDVEGYLFIEGRSDDTIIRGGENIAPAEIEDVLLRHPSVAEAAVVGVPDEEWGQRLAAAVVARPDAPAVDEEELREWVRSRLRGSKTPDVIRFRDELPHTDTGKLLRRQVLADLVQED